MVCSELRKQYDAFFTFCHRLGDAEIHRLSIRSGIPIIPDPKQVTRRQPLCGQSTIALSRRQKAALRSAFIEESQRIENGTLARVRVKGNVPVEIWREGES